LAPVQVIVLPISEKHQGYAQEVEKNLRREGCRVGLDLRNEKIGLKIREAEKAKVPFMIVVGDREAESKMVAVRQRNGKNLGTMAIVELMTLIREDMPEAVRKGS
ncbi:MAG: threonine--tRNA ligase, partial [Nitrospirales bacterium]|nr:threonine--tRNA ligase [Nitrospirales bacterium]